MLHSDLPSTSTCRQRVSLSVAQLQTTLRSRCLFPTMQIHRSLRPVWEPWNGCLKLAPSCGPSSHSLWVGIERGFCKGSIFAVEMSFVIIPCASNTRNFSIFSLFTFYDSIAFQILSWDVFLAYFWQDYQVCWLFQGKCADSRFHCWTETVSLDAFTSYW